MIDTILLIPSHAPSGDEGCLFFLFLFFLGKRTKGQTVCVRVHTHMYVLCSSGWSLAHVWNSKITPCSIMWY